MKQQPATPENLQELTYPAFGKGNIIFKNALKLGRGHVSFQESILRLAWDPNHLCQILFQQASHQIISSHLGENTTRKPGFRYYPCSFEGNSPTGWWMAPRWLPPFGPHAVPLWPLPPWSPTERKAAMLRLMLRGKTGIDTQPAGCSHLFRLNFLFA